MNNASRRVVGLQAPWSVEEQCLQAELREALRDPGRLPGDELFENAEYDDGSDEAFLRRLWHDLYGTSPRPRRAATPRNRHAQQAAPGRPGPGAANRT